MTQVTDVKNIVILGAGPCGMTAAWELVSNGYNVTIVEKDSAVGGLCKSISKGAYRFDLGGHRFISKSERLLNMVTSLMRDDMLLTERKSVILLQGREFEYPLAVKNLYKNLDFTLFAKAAFDYMKIALRSNGRDDHTFEGWIKNRYGDTLYDLFFGPYTAKLWGMSPSEISSDWAVQRIAAMKLSDVIMHLLRLKKDKKRTFTKRFYYPKKGIGQIFNKINEEITKKGAKVYLDSQPVSIGTRPSSAGAVRSVTIKTGEGLTELPCDHLISTIPLSELSALLHTGGRAGAPNGLSYRSLRFLNILVDKEEISQNTWMYVSEAKYFMTRIQEPKKRSPFNAPDSKTSVMLEIPCDVGDAAYTCSDDELFKKGLSALKRLGIDLAGSTTGYFSTYADHAYPVYSIDYKERIQEHLNIVRGFKNVMTCGRQGLFRYIFMDTAMVMGLTAADCVMGRAGTDDVYSHGLEKSLLEVKSIV